MSNLFQANVVLFGDRVGLGVWSMGHWLQHIQYNTILTRFTPPEVLPVYSIMECPLFDKDDRVIKLWLDAHENWHELLRQLINFTGTNLSDFDYRNPEYYYEWMDYHNSEHQVINVALGAV